MEQRRTNVESVMANGGSGGGGGTMVFWDMQTVAPPPNFEFLDHLLASHRAMGTGLFSLCPPVMLRAHGTEELPVAAHEYIVRNTLLLQQSISCGSELGSCWKAMIVDMLLWATDHAPGTADMVIISRVLDHYLADAIHQLHIRNYNIIVTPSFPPKGMTPLHEFIPTQMKMLQQMFDSALNGTKEVTAVKKEAMVANDKASIRATSSQTQGNGSQTSTLCLLMMKNCRIQVEDYIRKGITQFLESFLYASFRTRFGTKLCHKEVGFENLDAFLQAAVPGVQFKSILVETKRWILCNITQTEKSLTDNGVRESMQVPEAMSTVPEQQTWYYGLLTLEEVRHWLEEMVASGRADTGMNLSLLGKDFEERKKKKLDYKSLHSPTLMGLLSKFGNLVRLERNLSMVHLFPRDMPSSHRARPTVLEKVPMNRPFLRPQRNCIPEVPVRPPCTWRPPVPAQTEITKNIPTAIMPVPRFNSTAPNTATAVTPTTASGAVLSPVRGGAPSALVVENIGKAAGDRASEESHLPQADVAGLNGDAKENDQESLLAKPQPNSPEPSSRYILQANKPDLCPKIFMASETSISAPQISMASTTSMKSPLDVVSDAKLASSTSETKASDQAGGQASLPKADPVAGPTPGIEQVHQNRNGEDAKRGTYADDGSHKKLDYYRLTSSDQEREAIKRTFESVNRRLREEFKKRRLEVQPSVAEQRSNPS